MKIKKTLNNILFQYTITSTVLTLVIATLLINNMIKNSTEHSIKIHSEIYLDYIEAIPTNYPYILTLLIGEKELTINKDHGHFDHNHETEVENGDLDHFITDLLIFPSISKLQIFNKNKESIFEYLKDGEEQRITHDSSVIEKAYNGETLQIIHDSADGSILHTYLPVVFNDEIIGIVEIIDSTKNFSQYLEESNRFIFRSIIIGGLIFYLLLFTLFFRATKSQQKALFKLDKSQELTIHAMSLLAELRDDDTGSHILRTQEYCRILATELKRNKKYKKYITNEYIIDLERSAPLHDIGKVGVSDSILLKPGKLTDEEFNLMKKHPAFGAKVLSTVADKVDFKSYFTIGIQVILYHHENWDGSGYPNNLEGDKIPLSARIMTIADVYDALRTKRSYKDAFSHKKAVEIILEESGRKFDPDIVESFKNVESEFEIISNNPDFLK